ncbi:hypothetical protein [Flavobacterium sp. WC2430]|uniref:hypothetical protein n=1 Tax=Flavobacterium sp. WC2430 TaxID=3234137 RepID=UPI003465F404
MKKIFSSTYRKDYFKGYSIGLDPLLPFSGTKKAGFIAGFKSGRLDYEQMNGCISNGIPNRIVTEKVLEDFLIAGMFGLPIDAEEYTAYQINVISKWYQSGIEKYDPNEHTNLLELLEENGIVIN